MKRKNPWIWISLALLVILAIILLLCGPCGPCREGPGESVSTSEPSPGAEAEPGEMSPEKSAPSRTSSRTLRRVVDDHSSARRRIVPAGGDDAMKGSSKSIIAPTEEKTEPAKREASPKKTEPAHMPDPAPPEEYDFRTRLEIITDPSK